jgi:hypothetical protein
MARYSGVRGLEGEAEFAEDDLRAMGPGALVCCIEGNFWSFGIGTHTCLIGIALAVF